MNLHNAAAIVRDDVTTVRVAHTHDLKGENYGISSTTKRYDYKILKSLAAQLEPGMIVAVKNGCGITVAVVDEVHDEPQIDMENDQHINYRWAFQIVDVSKIRKREEEDERIVERLRNRQRQSVRQQTLAALGLTQSDVQLMLSDAKEE